MRKYIFGALVLIWSFLPILWLFDCPVVILISP